MALSPEQSAELAADIAKDPELNALPNTPDNAFYIADQYNLPSDPAFVVWRTNVSAQEIMNKGFVWTAVDQLSVSKARIWDWMSRYGSINPSEPNIRQGLADAFGQASAMAQAVLPVCKRSATRAEALYAVGTGTEASPGTLAWEGLVTYQEVQWARSGGTL